MNLEKFKHITFCNGNIILINADCKEAMAELQANLVDSIVSDPPYELGFMGKSWDSTGIANDKTMWAECLKLLKPGGHLLSFSGTRTYHRMASAIEDAGFEVRDMIEWVYGSGFPKSLNIGKAVDKLQGNESEWISESPYKASDEAERASAGKSQIGRTTHPDITKGNSEWEGWGTALKPAHEPICMARKPLSEKNIAENCLKWGTGGINIDKSRVAMPDRAEYEAKQRTFKRATGKIGEASWKNSSPLNDPETSIKNSELGRFPANLIHDNSEEVRECFPNESERFFKSIIYQSKASKSERNKGCEGLEAQSNMRVNALRENEEEKTSNKMGNHHPTVKPIALMEYLIKMVTAKGGIVLDPFMGSGTTGVAAIKAGNKFIGIELDSEYFEIACARIEEELRQGNK